MTDCQHCKRPCQLYLCADCTAQVADMVEQLPWLLDQLDARVQKLDRISVGTVGRSRGPDELDVMDFKAAETARDARKTLRDIVTVINGRGRPVVLQCTVDHTFIGPLRPAWRRLPAGYQPRTIELIDWLMRRTGLIARHRKAGHVYRELNRLVGSDQRGGQLVKAINPQEHHLVGPCPTLIGRNQDGTPRQCGNTLFADTYDRTVTCPECNQDIDVEATRRRAAAERDLHGRADLIEVLANIDEPVTEKQVDRWIRGKRLRPLAYRQGGAFKLNDQDEPLYSIKRAQQLRRRELNSTWRTRRWVDA